ncbi:MAG: hypothetical protein M3Y12_14180 [Bacteroidota bacterium]|nr:hypothetical protein [Bacteroidota bacterium]
MRHFLLLLLFITALLAAHAATNGIHSHLLIEAGNQFVLGGDQVGPFRVSARNPGRVPVLFLERSQQGAVVQRGRLGPGQSVQFRLAAGAELLVRNLGRARAELDLDLKGANGSKMVYEPAALTEK